MIKLGEKQTLEVIKTTDFGVYLSDTGDVNQEKVLLPKNQVKPETKLGDIIQVFIYKDSEDRLIATATEPLLTLGGVALLDVIEVGSIGAFLNWGLVKDLLLPFKEQTIRVSTGDQVLVALYIDKSSRLCATMKVYEYLSTTSPYKKDDKIIGTVYEISEEFGIFVAVDNQYSGLIPRIEVFQDLKPGDSVEARVVQVRDDGKLTLSLREKVNIQMDFDADTILSKLEANGGHINHNDKSDPKLIKKDFGLSKNAFKRAVGRLLKEEKITISDSGIDLIQPSK